jgi:Telomere-binding protein beta subunit (TEBP beta)
MFSGTNKIAISAKKEGAGVKISAFKTLIFEMLQKGGDFSKVREQIRNSQIKCWVKQTFPRFLISDGTFFTQAYFTKEAFARCH